MGVGTGNMGQPGEPGRDDVGLPFLSRHRWTVPGGGISNDFSAVVSASLLWNQIGHIPYASTSNLVADVQHWVANPGTNFGWLFMSESENVLQTVRRIGAREDIKQRAVAGGAIYRCRRLAEHPECRRLRAARSSLFFPRRDR